MRIWDVEPIRLCRNHLLGEHRELHAIWEILTKNKTGYSKHPETLRWRGKLKALYQRHENLVKEMSRRGYLHHSPLELNKATGMSNQIIFIDTYQRQLEILQSKKCECNTKWSI